MQNTKAFPLVSVEELPYIPWWLLKSQNKKTFSGRSIWVNTVVSRLLLGG